MKATVRRIPVIGDVAGLLYRRLAAFRLATQAFPGSAQYWVQRSLSMKKSDKTLCLSTVGFWAAVLQVWIAG